MSAVEGATPLGDAPEGREIILEARGLALGYGQIPVIRDLDLTVRAGEVVALLGANGAGKTTTLLGLAGHLPATCGTVRWLGHAVKSPMHQRCREGLGFVPEARAVIFGLTVAENLRLGGGELHRALDLFPELEPLMKRKAGLLSGGEQQMLALAGVLSRRPKVLLIDELSLGLAPLIVARLLAVVRQVADESGIGVLLVEQQVRNVLRVADSAAVLRRGRIVMTGSATSLIGRVGEVEAMYLSGSSELTEGSLGSLGESPFSGTEQPKRGK